MVLTRFAAVIVALCLSTSVGSGAAAQGMPEQCWQSAVSVIISNDRENHTEHATCQAACAADVTCAGWNFRRHSFDPAAAGHCQLLGDIYRSDPSETAFCGRIER